MYYLYVYTIGLENLPNLKTLNLAKNCLQVFSISALFMHPPILSFPHICISQHIYMYNVLILSILICSPFGEQTNSLSFFFSLSLSFTFLFSLA